MNLLRTAALLLAAAGAAQAFAGPAACQADAGRVPPVVVELYTSEGCSSCPPADRWLSSLQGRGDVLTLAFHVDYWDRLGWVDRFASPAITARQYALARTAGSAQVYTPQVVANGRDWRSWPKLPAAGAPSPVTLSLAREGDRVHALVGAASQGPARLEGYWAVLEDHHESKVRAGENAGETLRHDSVVRLYQPVAAWPAAAGAELDLAVSRGVPEHPRRVAFVVTDPATQRPLQAAVLGC